MAWSPASPWEYSSGGSFSLIAATRYRPPLTTTTPISRVAIVVRSVIASPTSSWVATIVATAEKMLPSQVLTTSTPVAHLVQQHPEHRVVQHVPEVERQVHPADVLRVQADHVGVELHVDVVDHHLRHPGRRQRGGQQRPLPEGQRHGSLLSLRSATGHSTSRV